VQRLWYVCRRMRFWGDGPIWVYEKADHEHDQYTKGVMMSDFQPKIIIFCCNWCSYAGADLAGVSRLQIDPHFRVIRTMCSGRIEPEFVLSAFEKGADGILLGEGPEEGPVGKVIPIMEERIKLYAQKLEEKGIDPFKLWFNKIYITEGEKLVDLFRTFTDSLDED